MRTSKMILLSLALALAGQVSATTMFQIHGQVKQIKNGRVEIRDKQDFAFVDLKKLDPKTRAAITRAVASKKDVHLAVVPSALMKAHTKKR